MPVGLDHDVKDLANERSRNRFVEQIAHTVHEDSPGLAPY
jgi:hypothetical protein